MSTYCIYVSLFVCSIECLCLCVLIRMCGPEAIIEMRRWGYRGLVVGLSGNADETQFLDAGADGFMLKPFNREVRKVLPCVMLLYYCLYDYLRNIHYLPIHYA
jgi:CheY-like chemotaxis protein